MESVMPSVAPQIQKQAFVTEPPNGYSIPVTFARDISDTPPSSHALYENVKTWYGNLKGFFGAYIPCCCCSNPMKTITQGNVGLVSKFGVVYKILDPGLHSINTETEFLEVVSVSIQVMDIPRQEVMTKDNVNVSIDSVLYWHIVDPFVARCQVADISLALRERAQTTLRDSIGSRDLHSLVSNRDDIALDIKRIIEDTAKSWGVGIESILIKDLQFSKDLMDDLSAVAAAKRVGESKVIAARAEVTAAKLMREASDILNTPAAMQIRYLETLANMSKAPNTKVIFTNGENESDLVSKTVIGNI
ncbi:Band 7 protein domain-containing protein [Rozella allomycis CSF55]|uniref:Band 7 protein domain-containing protein n=1 Tax=Rozella allomycis (strain CSF55) TaxID=988480 RepID=A0A075B1J4_ROZAC|nr:Band 7 protein domain-containing protein [Rozella allomycis CSF55]|eukprot:EPZ34841.1 Band 7 protein domain-containing protein [Rozella allomycis CSF55]